jgi:hypothetical protein
MKLLTTDVFSGSIIPVFMNHVTIRLLQGIAVDVRSTANTEFGCLMLGCEIQSHLGEWIHVSVCPVFLLPSVDTSPCGS